MRRTRCGAGLALIVVLLPACHEADRVIEDGLPSGAYAYAGFDSAGAQVATGWLTVPANPPTGPGEWHFSPTGAGDPSGHPLGQGTVVPDGMYFGPGLWESLLLYPEGLTLQSGDAGFVAEWWRLSGGEAEGTATGTWWHHFAGQVSDSGTFRAVRRP